MGLFNMSLNKQPWQYAHIPDWNQSNTGFIASPASMQLKWSFGLGIAGARSSKGSMIRLNPSCSKVTDN
jgi:hypothetical protein